MVASIKKDQERSYPMGHRGPCNLLSTNVITFPVTASSLDLIGGQNLAKMENEFICKRIP